jgi:phage shock protein E
MDLRELINSPETIIVDVRSSYEYMAGNVAGSINIPLDEVPERVEEFSNMSGNIVLCCVSGARSGQAQAFLSMKGVENVFNAGGWTEVNYYKYEAA